LLYICGYHRYCNSSSVPFIPFYNLPPDGQAFENPFFHHNHVQHETLWQNQTDICQVVRCMLLPRIRDFPRDSGRYLQKRSQTEILCQIRDGR
jgi:hypothetical protein